MDQVGRRAWPLDWEARSAGGVSYTADVVPPGALVGVILRSPHPHALIESIDISAALRMPGVHAVITSKSLPPGARYMHERTFDRAPLADGVVRFVGQEVAAVAAETREQGQAALAAIEVKYKRLAAPFKVAEALQAGAPTLYDLNAAPPPGMASASGQPPGPAAGGAPPPGVAPPGTASGAGAPPGGPPPVWYDSNLAANVRRGFRRLWGDVEKGRRAATVAVSGRFWFGQQTHICMETNRTLAEWKDDRLHLWTSTASPINVQRQLAFVLGLPPKTIVVHEIGVGGSFGSKVTICDHEAIAATLAREARLPVFVALTREEEFETTKSRHGFEIDMTMRADAAGKLRTIEGEVRVDNGAYIHSGGSVMAASMFPLGVMYDADGLDIDVKLVDTSKVPGGALRGYGGPQTTFPREVLMDELAEKLGRDPIDFRIQNTYPGHCTGLAGHLGSHGGIDCLQAVRKAINWDHEKANKIRGRGVGVATGDHVGGAYVFPDSNRCDGIIDLYADGRLRVRFGGSDAGTGQKTILAQIAAHELGVPLDRISVLSMDTDQAPWDMGAWSSRGTHYTGHGIRLTAQEFAQRLKQLAAEKLGAGEIRLEQGFARGATGELPLGALVALSNESVEGVLTYKASFVDRNVEMMHKDGSGNITATHCFAAHAALVDVDEKTGKVRVLDYAAANDSGTAINPLLLEGQISGAVVMGIGGALSEELIFEQGKLVNPAFLHYAVPRAADVPRIRPVHAPKPDQQGPYGAKSVGEVGIVPTAPAISNAVYDAIGVRVRSLPITPDKIINGLAAQQGRRRTFHLWRRPGRWYIEIVRKAYPLGLLEALNAWQMRNAQAAPPPPPIKAVETPATPAELVRALGADAAILGGGTDLQLCRRQNISAPARLIAVARVPQMQALSVPGDGPLVIGGAVTLAALAEAVREKIPALADTIDEIATPQIRNVATVAGNLRQQKRCWFFRNGFPCYKRKGSLAACYSVMGDHRFYHAAIDGHRCQAVTPSDLATTLVALDATATILGPSGSREVQIEALYTGPGETVLSDRDVITQIAIPAQAMRRGTAFKKLNLWQGDFAVASAAVSVQLDDNGRCQDVRICLGAVAPVPWRARATEKALMNEPCSAAILRMHLDAELNERAHPLERNVWKLDAVAGLAERAVEALASPASEPRAPSRTATDLRPAEQRSPVD